MSTLIEDRLAAALQARADQVAPEDLRPLEVPETTRRPWRPVLAGLAAAAAVAAVAVPLARGGADEDQPTPPATSTTPSPSPSVVASPFVETSRAEGDVDGDGAADVVRTDEQGMVRIDLADGSRAELQQPLGSSIEGLAELGPPGLAVVLGIDSGDERPAHVLRWVDGRLEEVQPAGDAWIGSRVGQTFWVEDRVLYTGTFQGPLDEQVRVDTRAWGLRDGGLRSNPMGERCWLPSEKEPHPVSCSSFGSEYDVGPRGDLPALFPAVDMLYKVGDTWAIGGSESAELVGRSGEYVEKGDVELVVHVDGVEARADVPAGGPPELLGGRVRTRGDAPAFVVRQEGGDSMAMTVFTFWNGELVALPQPTGAPFGNGFREVDGSTPYHLTWLSEEGVLYTGEGIDEATGRSRTHLWRWSDDLGNRLTAEDLGVACLDFSVDPTTYGRCP
jgi:hypothetical protein